ncbi:hypothetical protein [Streptosporangium sp. OZ121]|uniref:hypothetical protein n=1 Tax=Streptosporangium sp. OZ121 TaxID=3444183 RepID=UPI003F78E566
MSRARAERLERLRELCFTQKRPIPVGAAARLLDVDERTAQRYAREIEGGIDRRTGRYNELYPLILAHLQKYPRSLFTSGEIARVINRVTVRWCHSSTAATTLGRMEREGLVTSSSGVRSNLYYDTLQKVIYWRLAEQETP